MYRGFIAIWRKLLETSFYKDSYAVHLAIHLILKANHEPKEFIHSRKKEYLERGQLLTGRKKLAYETGINESTIRHKLELFLNIGFLTIKKTNKFSIITICNYSEYQDTKLKIDQHNDQQKTNKRPSEDQQKTTNNNITTKNHLTIKTNKVFTPPTHQEVTNYCIERKNGIDPQSFIDYYQARGWKFKNGQPVTDWEACVRTWENRDKRPVDTLTETQRRNITKFKQFEQLQEVEAHG